LAALGVPIIRYQGETIAALKQSIQLTGQALGGTAAGRANALVTYVDQQLAGVKAISAAAPATARKRVFVSGTTPLKTAGKDMLQSEMVQAAGGVNVAADLAGYWPEVNLEQVAAWNPEVIFVVQYKGTSVETITQNPQWAGVDAVKKGQVFLLPRYLGPWDTPVPESILGIVWMTGKLYPDSALVKECPARVANFYRTFYNLELAANEVSELCR
jgi:iron complex transport system substrate-binding protein